MNKTPRRRLRVALRRSHTLYRFRSLTDALRVWARVAVFAGSAAGLAWGVHRVWTRSSGALVQDVVFDTPVPPGFRDAFPVRRGQPLFGFSARRWERRLSSDFPTLAEVRVRRAWDRSVHVTVRPRRAAARVWVDGRVSGSAARISASGARISGSAARISGSAAPGAGSSAIGPGAGSSAIGPGVGSSKELSGPWPADRPRNSVEGAATGPGVAVSDSGRWLGVDPEGIFFPLADEGAGLVILAAPSRPDAVRALAFCAVLRETKERWTESLYKITMSSDGEIVLFLAGETPLYWGTADAGGDALGLKARRVARVLEAPEGARGYVFLRFVDDRRIVAKPREAPGARGTRPRGKSMTERDG